MEPVLDGCPVHHLDPGATVWLDYDGWRQPWCAALLCESWHDTAPLREAFTRAIHIAVARAAMSPEPVGGE